MKEKLIVVIQYKRLETLPPVMSLLEILHGMGRKVIFVGVWSEAGARFLEARHIDHRFIPYRHELYLNNSLFEKVWHRVLRALGFFSKRKALRALLADLDCPCEDMVLWFIDTKSVALLGDDFRLYPHRVISIYEMQEDEGRCWLGFNFRECLGSSVIVVPEYNRAHILREHYRLRSIPLVVANKPAEHPRKVGVSLNTEAKKVFDAIGKRPVFLYQGVWTSDRQDVGIILETIARKRPDYCVLMLPSSDAAMKLLAPYPNAFSLPYIAPPGHLAVTSRATVGVAVYNASGRNYLQRLNAVYCAPNKIYEYAGFGIPTLGNNLPGLKYTIEAAHAGVCCDLNEESILKAADELVNNIDAYRANANRFFDETDLNKQVSDVLKVAEER